MKKTLIVLIALFAMVAFVSGAVAQQKPETPQSQKHKAPKAMHFKGTVAAYEAGKMIKVKGAKEKEMTFDIAANAKIKGEVKEGAKVVVMYKKDGDKMVATSISAAAPKKPKAEKKAEEKK
jgi:Ni,Fe-hydrogenase III component G